MSEQDWIEDIEEFSSDEARWYRSMYAGDSFNDKSEKLYFYKIALEFAETCPPDDVKRVKTLATMGRIADNPDDAVQLYMKALKLLVAHNELTHPYTNEIINLILSVKPSAIETDKYLRKIKERLDKSMQDQVFEPGQEWNEPVTGMTFVYIKPGCSWYGCYSLSDKCNNYGLPEKKCMDGFWMGK